MSIFQITQFKRVLLPEEVICAVACHFSLSSIAGNPIAMLSRFKPAIS